MWIAAAALFAAVMVFGLPVIAKHTPWRVERWLAGVFGGKPSAAPCKGRAQADALEQFQRVVKRVYPLDAEDSALPITIEMIPGKTVNAYATLGGHIYVFDGLLQQAQSAEELAGVLAHEIGHMAGGHLVRQADGERQAALYNVACCHARLGNVREGLAALAGCLESG